jgi:hypothetical protein
LALGKAVKVLAVTCEGYLADGAIRALRPFQPLLRATRFNEQDRTLWVYVEDDLTEIQAGAIGLALMQAGCGPHHEVQP